MADQIIKKHRPFYYFSSLIIFASGLLSFNCYAEAAPTVGEKLFQQHCNVCHGSTNGKRVAPPIAGVKLHYKSVHADKKPFVKAVSDWIAKPDADKSLMPGAIRHFNLMPVVAVPAEDAKKIAEYIYEGDIKIPESYRKHFEQKHGTNTNSRQQHNAQDQRFRTLLNRQLRISSEQIADLQLSSEQLAALKKLIIEKEAIMQPLREEVLAFNRQLQTLDTRSPNYKSEIFALADINAKRVEQMVVESGEMRMKIESILTNTQYQKLQQVRKQMIERFKNMRQKRTSQ